MKALVLESNGKLAVRQVLEPVSSSKDWIRVKVDAAGICGSDIPRAFDGGAYHYPLIMGHEFAGTVSASNKDALVNEGDRVAVFPLLPCRSCDACRSHDYAQCVDYDYFGSRRDGGFAEYVWAPAANLAPVPEHVSQPEAAMTEPCAVALHGVRKLPVEPGSSAIVYGAGPIGNLAAQWLKLRGCSSVTLVDIDERKLEIARRMGFICQNPAEGNPVEEFPADSRGHGYDLAVEACGLPTTYRQALQSAGRGASVLFLGNIKGTFELDQQEFSTILRKELRLFGTWNSTFEPRGRDDWSISLRAMGRREIDVDALISHQVPLDEGLCMFEGMRNRAGSGRNSVFFNKVILLPGSEE